MSTKNLGAFMLQACLTISGKTVLVPSSTLLPRYSAYGIVHSAGSLLLITAKQSGKYWFPGGRLEEAEPSREAVEREIFEETGIQAYSGPLLWEVSSHLYLEGQGYRQFSAFYLCEALSTTISAGNNPDSRDDATLPQWVSLSVLNPEDFQDYGGALFADLPKNFFDN